MKMGIFRAISALLALMLVLCGCTPAVSDSESPDGDTPAPARATELTVDLRQDGMEISDNLFGLFLEDINFAVDAGLYAELVKNRSFEYRALASGGAKHGWGTTSDAVNMDTASSGVKGMSLNENNPTYIILTNEADTPEGIYNTGYLDGMAVAAGENYTASVFVRGTADITFSLEDRWGKVLAEAGFTADCADWHKYSVTLTPSETLDHDLRLVMRMSPGTVHIDMVSLMPNDTYGGIGIRRDIGEALEALSPSFLRFPGGCVTEGKSEESMYNWKDSIGNGIDFTVNGESAVGDVAARPQTTDLWVGSDQHPYYCTYGLGFYEYFLLCEELGCAPVPIVNAGMTCPIQSSNYVVFDVDSDKFRQYVQDALDLVEFCRGGADTEWGAVRIAMGHEEIFDLRYLGIGNEQWQTEYFQHYSHFVRAFEQAAAERPEIYGGIELIVANGPASGSTEGWRYIRNNPDSMTTLVDEHYYEPVDWFLANTERYDAYDRREDVKVFLGEYASKTNTMNSALAEAAYMTGIERNGDIIELACYAPLFGNSTLNQWTPDMIFFSNHSLYFTPNYHVQSLFANNAGTEYLDTGLVIGDLPQNELSGGVGLASWMTSVAYDDLMVTDNATGRVLYENDFEGEDAFDEFDDHTGDWSIEDGRLVQHNTASPADTNTGDAVYIGDTGWSDYTLTLKAEILGGDEGFLIPICVENTQNNVFWNLGGWGNTVSCLEIISGGVKSGQVSGTVSDIRLNKGQVYELKITVSGSNIKCWLDGKLSIDYTYGTDASLFASTVRDENGDVIIKLVNVTDTAIPVSMSLPGLGEGYSSEALLTILKADSGAAVNSFSKPDNIAPTEQTLAVSDSFVYEAEAYSLSVIRISEK